MKISCCIEKIVRLKKGGESMGDKGKGWQSDPSGIQSPTDDNQNKGGQSQDVQDTVGSFEDKAEEDGEDTTGQSEKG